MTLLCLHGVSKSFGAIKVADGISIGVAPGETLGILGPNGAGKTTLFNIVSGEVRPDSGRVELAGVDITALAPHRRCRLGIGRTYQIPRPFAGMTVFENCVTAASFGARLPERAGYSLAMEVLERAGLAMRANTPAGTLPLLDRKRLELARALCTNPRVLLLDEIAGGLTDEEAKVLVGELRRIKESGVAIIWIEHVVHALLSLADRLLVLNFGARVAEGPPHEVMSDPRVRRVYLGMDVGHDERRIA